MFIGRNESDELIVFDGTIEVVQYPCSTRSDDMECPVFCYIRSFTPVSVDGTEIRPIAEGDGKRLIIALDETLEDKQAL